VRKLLSKLRAKGRQMITFQIWHLSESGSRDRRVSGALLGNSLDACQVALWHRCAEGVDRVEREGALELTKTIRKLWANATDCIVAETARDLHLLC
jgi:hypothetical protein